MVACVVRLYVPILFFFVYFLALLFTGFRLFSILCYVVLFEFHV